MAKLFGTDGIRGIANRELDCELALKVGRAVAAAFSDDTATPTVLMGCDTRASSDMLCAAITAGICSMGADVIDLGVVPTPAVAYLTAKYNACAGIMVSASHNPPEFNGIKIIGAGGLKLPDEKELLIEDLILNDAARPTTADGFKVGKRKPAPLAIEEYISHVLSSASCQFNGLRVALDCANGSACATAARIFKQTGAELHLLNTTPDGLNINRNCGSTHLKPLAEYVVENGLDCGVAFDGDADRCLCIDEKGNEIDGDAILAMCALDMWERGCLCGDTVVGTVMSNMGLGKLCKANGIGFVAAKVGDRYVLEQLLEHGYSLGGEQSGHIIFADHATTGDGQLTAVQILDLMSRKGKSLSALASVMTRYPQTMINVTVTPEGRAKFSQDPVVKDAIDSVTQQLGDSGRILVRASGTEPLIRVMVEGADKQLVLSLAQSTAEIIRKQLS